MSGPEPTADPRAIRVLRAAHEAVYRWPVDFGGFSASVDVAVDGEVRHRGDLRVLARHGARFVPLGTDAPDPQIATEIVGIGTTLAPKDFGELDGRYGAAFAPDLDRPSGRAVTVDGDPRRTIRWCADGRLRETEADHGEGRRHVMVIEWVAVGERRWLPTIVADQVTTAGRTRCRDVVDEWVEVDGALLPGRRTVHLADERRLTVDIVLRNHVLRALPAGRHASGS